VGKRDGWTEAFDRSIDIGAKEHIMPAIGKQDKGGAVSRAQDREARVVQQTA
jgi:hypothetical protein